MLIFMGPAGSGKSVQGKLLAKSHNYRWISIGEILRSSSDEELHRIMDRGELLDDVLVEKILSEELDKHKEINKIILDGFPRSLAQAKWLITFLKDRGDLIKGVIHIEVDEKTNVERLLKRGREDDTEEAIKERYKDYVKLTLPIVQFFKDQTVKVQDIDGIGTVDEVHNRIVNSLSK